ncbi:MAG TPA: alpha/beta hydrolase [Actinomycetales bacterium]|nr:alpha/beta hydrolase [Actinomycetales bacterium]
MLYSPPPFDPEIAAALEERDDIVTGLNPEEILTLRRRAPEPALDQMVADGYEHSLHTLSGPDGNHVELLALRPRGSAGTLPVLFHVHGGGLIVGTPYDGLPELAGLANAVGFALVSVGYRLAPEHKYPAAVEDVYAGLNWVAANGHELGVDPNRIVIEGMSAGGGLAAAATLLARDRHGPKLRGQMLLYPMLDDRNASGSALQMEGIGAWDRTANETGWSAYLGSPRRNVSPYAAPSRADDLSGLPPTYIEVGSAETFRDENVEYAQGIWAAGGDAELHVWAGGAHGFDALAPDSLLAADARDMRIRWLSRLSSRWT